MGMRSYANTANVITEDFVKSTASKEFDAFQTSLADTDMSFDDFASRIMYSDEEDIETSLFESYNELCEVFEGITGLSLDLGYIDSETDTDIAEGGFWCVGNCYILTESAKKHQANIQLQEGYVIFG